MLCCVICVASPSSSLFFFFNDTATTEIYTLSLHDALPISGRAARQQAERGLVATARIATAGRPRPPGSADPENGAAEDRKSTRLNSSHSQISYAVFCLKKKKRQRHNRFRCRSRCRSSHPPH